MRVGLAKDSAEADLEFDRWCEKLNGNSRIRRILFGRATGMNGIRTNGIKEFHQGKRLKKMLDSNALTALDAISGLAEAALLN